VISRRERGKEVEERGGGNQFLGKDESCDLVPPKFPLLLFEVFHVRRNIIMTNMKCLQLFDR